MPNFVIMKYFVLATVFLFACKAANNKLSPEPVTQNNITIDSITATMPTANDTMPAIFESAFEKGISMKVDGRQVELYGRSIGDIDIPSGKLLVCDPFLIWESRPFDKVFPRGRFPVQLSIMRINDDERTAFARIKFSDMPVEKWEVATENGPSTIPMSADPEQGYGVEGGIAVFIDSLPAQYFVSETSESMRKLGDVFIGNPNEKTFSTWSYLVQQAGQYNFASFSTGYGDGFYSCFIGYDKNGNVCRLLTDFKMVDW